MVVITIMMSTRKDPVFLEVGEHGQAWARKNDTSGMGEALRTRQEKTKARSYRSL
jgi:hypothetical protein